MGQDVGGVEEYKFLGVHMAACDNAERLNNCLTNKNDDQAEIL